MFSALVISNEDLDAVGHGIADKKLERSGFGKAKSESEKIESRCQWLDFTEPATFHFSESDYPVVRSSFSMFLGLLDFDHRKRETVADLGSEMEL
jgi:hypothetical protein